MRRSRRRTYLAPTVPQLNATQWNALALANRAGLLLKTKKGWRPMTLPPDVPPILKMTVTMLARRGYFAINASGETAAITDQGRRALQQRPRIPSNAAKPAAHQG